MAGKTSRKPAKVAVKAAAERVAAEPVLLSGGNPQIAKGYGDAPVQAYIAAMPGWKSDLGRRLDAIIVRTVPGVQQGGEVEFAFLWHRGPWLVPRLPLLHEVHQGDLLSRHVAASSSPGESKHKEVRYLDIHEDQLDEAQFTDWVKQASQLPGERM